jgi:hypothetical protein
VVQRGRLSRELRTIKAMVRLYCRRHHGADGKGPVPCATCQELVDHAERRLERCPYGSRKPTCARCPIHCYRPDIREKVREVMRYAGPRMLRRHPILALMHLLESRREIPERPDRPSRRS